MALSADARNRLSIALTDFKTIGPEVADAIDAGDGSQPVELASTANGKGASRIGIEDAAAFFAAGTVEGALAEVMKYIPLTLADPGTGAPIPVTRSANIAITTAAAETNTLAIPTFIGQKLILTMNVRAVGDRVVTAAVAVNQTGNNTLTFGAAGDTIILEAIKVAGTLRWRVTSNDGVALSTV